MPHAFQAVFQEEVGLPIFVAVAMIAQQVVGKAVRDAYFLSVFPPAVLARVMTVSSILSVVGVWAMMMLYRRHPPARLVPALFAGSGTLFAVAWLLMGSHPRVAAIILYLHTASFGAVAISGFWAVMNERFDPHTAKRVLGRVAGGATLGGVLGGVAAWQGASVVPIPTLLLTLAMINVLCGLGVGVIGSGIPQSPVGALAPAPPRHSAWRLFDETPYLRHVALVVVLVALGTAGVDYVFKARAATSLRSGEELVSFFALFYLATGVAAFVAQNVLAQPLLRVTGITTLVTTLPATLLLLGPVALFLPGVLGMAVLRGGAATVESSFFRSGYELLYTPLAPAAKRPAKTLIDVGGDKLGAALGGALAVFLVGLIPDMAPRVLLLVALGCALVAVGLSRYLARGYLKALADSLESGTVQPEDVTTLDASSRAQVQHTMAAIDRAAFLKNLNYHPGNVATSPTVSRANATPVSLARPPHPLRTVAGLRPPSKSDTTRSSLFTPEEEQVWVPRAITALGKTQEIEIQTQLQQVAPAYVGALTDALLNRRVPLLARRRIAEILHGVPTRRCAQNLTFALDAQPFEISFRAARALATIVAKNPTLSVDETLLYRRAAQAIETTHCNFGSETTPGQQSVANAGQVVAFCWRLLSVMVPPAPWYWALDALAASEKSRRGTGLEYVENVLPSELKDTLLPLLQQQVVVAYANRGDDAVLADLEHTSSPGTLEEWRNDSTALKMVQR